MKFYISGELYSLNENTNFSNQLLWSDLVESIESYNKEFLIPMRDLIKKKLVVELIDGIEVENKNNIQLMIDCNIETINFIRSQLS